MMSPDIRRLLRDAAQPPVDPVDPDAIHARGRRRRASRSVGGTMAGVAAVLLALAIGQQLFPQASPLIGEIPSPSQSPTTGPTPTPSTSGDPSPTPSNLDASPMPTLLVLEETPGSNDRVRVISPDGSEEVIELEAEHVIAFFSDGSGGVIYQPRSLEGTGPILRAHQDGSTTTLVGSMTRPEYADLKGVDRSGAAIVEMGVISSPDETEGDLVLVPFDGSNRSVVATDAAGWEYGVAPSSWGADGTFLYWTVQHAGNSVIAGQLGGPWITVLERTDTDEERVGDVALSPDGDECAILLVTGGAAPAPPSGQVRLAFASGLPEVPMLGESVSVPMDLGLDRPAEAVLDSWEGALVLVNRWDLESWRQPLVYDRSTQEWSVLDVEGHVKFGW